MRTLTPIDIEHIILMAWADTILFETIFLEYGLTENQVRALMRKHQSESTYRRWRERIRSRCGAKSKHAQKTAITSTKQKF